MAKDSEIKRRIKSVDNTRKITRTMEMVATSKLKRATDRVRAAAPYAEALADIVAGLYSPALAEQFPILRQPPEIKRAAVVLMSANRGLCGAFNANLIREASLLLDELEGKGIETELHAVGKKGAAYFRFRGRPLAGVDESVGDQPTNEDAARIIGPLQVRYEQGELDALYLISVEFKSAMSTPAQTKRLLPLDTGNESGSSADVFILSPSGAAILGRTLPAYMRNQVYLSLVENTAGEQGARRTAMKSATDNAGDMLVDLTRTYNRARQAKITQEIAEIVGGAAALE
jgi:F-type H+-transporting ATPase subunit gamma